MTAATSGRASNAGGQSPWARSRNNPWCTFRRNDQRASGRSSFLLVMGHDGGSTMVTKGLLVRLEAKHGKEAEVEQFLASALPLVHVEPATQPGSRGMSGGPHPVMGGG